MRIGTFLDFNRVLALGMSWGKGFGLSSKPTYNGLRKSSSAHPFFALSYFKNVSCVYSIFQSTQPSILNGIGHFGFAHLTQHHNGGIQ